MGFLLSIVIVVCLTTNIKRITTYCHRLFKKQQEHPEQQTGLFGVFRLEDVWQYKTGWTKQCMDYYKIGLIRGSNRSHYADNSIAGSATTLVFFNPHAPYTWESLEGDKTGFCCVFSAPFFTTQMQEKINALPMFMAGGKPVQALTKEQDKAAADIFVRMLEEWPSDYRYKYDLLRNYVTQLIHLALKMQMSEGAGKKGEDYNNREIHN